MSVVCDKEPIVESVRKYFSSFGFLFERFFQGNEQKTNALVVLQKLKEKTIDPKIVADFLSKLPQERWTVKVMADNVEELNNLFGTSDEEIIKHCVSEVNKEQLQNLKWEISVLSMLESSSYANEYYDAFKYNQNPKLSVAKIRLITELMSVLKYLKESSKKISDRFEHVKLSEISAKNFNELRFPIELLWLRILYVLLNLNDASDEKIEELTKTLAVERISISYQKVILPKYK